jgi:SAM-dependent methyltransferase
LIIAGGETMGSPGERREESGGAVSVPISRRPVVRSILAVPPVFRLFGRLVRRRTAQRTLVTRYLQVRGKDRVLDIGCGLGDILEDLPDVDYLGFDLSRPYIRAARRRWGRRGRFFCAPVDSGLLRDEAPFDLILAKGVLHHLDDEQAGELLRLARRKLKPSGRLVTVDGCWIPGQPRLEKWFLAHDRGRYVRDRDGYAGLAGLVFPKIEAGLHRDFLRIPYSHLIMVCVL